MYAVCFSGGKLADWRVESIEQLASSSDEDEFFDARGEIIYNSLKLATSP